MDRNRLKSYLNYLRRSKTHYGVHSPFVYSLITNCLYDKKTYSAYATLKNYRKYLLRDGNVLTVNDVGAPSKVFKQPERTVKSMAKVAGSSMKELKLWYRLAKYFAPGKVLELGTHLGLSALAWRLGADGEVVSVEKSGSLLQYAREHLPRYTNKEIQWVQADFGDFLNASDTVWDLVFVDGNHTYEATMQYFELLKKRSHNGTLLIFHDIHWSEGMEKAWQDIVSDTGVHVTIDLFCCGLVFFRREQFKEHFIIRF
jgi:predicted O-methyltransferase YrrM